MNIDYKNFYSGYAYDYFIHKSGTLQAILENFEQFKESMLNNYITGIDEEDYTRFIKSEIRVTVFQSIETLFELILALDPKGGKLKDCQLLENLSISSWQDNYRRILSIATDSESLNFLNALVKIGGEDIEVWKYIFYFNMKVRDEHAQMLEESKQGIQLFLSGIAKIFSVREEYNAYKHGVRILNTFKSFQIIPSDQSSEGMTFDLKDSVSFFFERKHKEKNNEYVVKTKVFHTNRDLRIINLCGFLISNIIQIRKFALMPEELKQEEAIYFLNEKDVLECLTMVREGGIYVDDIKFKTEKFD